MERSTTLPVTTARLSLHATPLPPRAALHTLPPELLVQIFHPGPDPSAAHGEEDDDCGIAAPPLHLSPRSIPICRVLLPFARKNAYHHIELEGGLDGLARFGKVVDEREGGCHWIGGMVKRVTVRGASSQSAETRSVPDGYLRAAFDAFENVERVDLELSGTEWQRLVSSASPSPLRSRAFNRPKEEGGISLRVRLVEDDPRPVGLLTLAQIGRSGARGIRALTIQGRLPHRIQCGDGRGSSGDVEGTVTPPLTGMDGEGGDREMWTGLEKLELQCEPHSVGLTRFFSSLAGLKELCWTTPGTIDPSMVTAAIPMNVCNTLEALEWTSFGYASRDLGFAFSNLPSLRSLTIRSSSAVLSQPFFVALHAHNPHLEHLALRGPHAGTGRGPADTCALVAEWVEALLFETEQGGEAAASALRRLELEVPIPTPAFARPASGRPACEERPPTRLEVQANRLAVACARLNVTLGGSVLDAIHR